MVQTDKDMGLQFTGTVLRMFRRVVLASPQGLDGTGARIRNRSAGFRRDAVSMTPQQRISQITSASADN
jgi:hypothetical protein